MTPLLYVLLGAALGLVAGICINAKGKQESDDRIKELEKDIIVRQNVADALNDSVNRLRRENERLKKKIKNI